MEFKDELKQEEFNRLCYVLSKLRSEEEIGAMLEDLCTVTEIMAMCQRLEVARLLDSGENYQSIARITGASSTTVSRVSRCLNYGAGGYPVALDKLKKERNR